jgi:hypothetical protein
MWRGAARAAGAAFQLATGVAFAAFASVRPARELLEERDVRARATRQLLAKCKNA